jgi:biotin carboxyl carrier protein
VTAKVLAPLAGRVWKIERRAGDPVAAGDVLVILESMKMEVPVEAPRAGTVTEVKVAEGDAVNEGDLLVIIE